MCIYECVWRPAWESQKEGNEMEVMLRVPRGHEHPPPPSTSYSSVLMITPPTRTSGRTVGTHSGCFHLLISLCVCDSNFPSRSVRISLKWARLFNSTAVEATNIWKNGRNWWGISPLVTFLCYSLLYWVCFLLSAECSAATQNVLLEFCNDFKIKNDPQISDWIFNWL